MIFIQRGRVGLRCALLCENRRGEGNSPYKLGPGGYIRRKTAFQHFLDGLSDFHHRWIQCTGVRAS